MEIPEDSYGLQATALALGSENIDAELGLDYGIFCSNSSDDNRFLEENNNNMMFTMDQQDSSHVNSGYVNNEGNDVMFYTGPKYEAGMLHNRQDPIDIPRLPLQPEPIALTPPLSVGSNSPMDERGHMVGDSTIDTAKFSSLLSQQPLLSNGLRDPSNASSGFLAHNTACETEPRRKRRKTEPEMMVTDSPVGIVTIKTEPGCLDDVFVDTDSSSSLSPDLYCAQISPDTEPTSYQCLKWTEFKKSQWHELHDESCNTLPTIDFHVDADKGFNFSFADDSFVCQKKNHFQITVTVQTSSTPKYIKVKDTFKPIEKFKLHLFGVKVESINTTIKIEQSQADRSKRPYDPVVIPVSGKDSSRITVGRLHFSETTSNNMRKKGKPNPDQRYFMLAVALHAHTKNENQMVCAMVSDRIIVRASNPGQFENDVEVVWSRGQSADSVFRVGRVGINTDKPNESLSVHGNVTLTGRVLMPSDKRVKENITEVDSSEQLRNVSRMKLYRYSYSQEYLDIAGVETNPDTGVIAQEVQEVLPDAVKQSDDVTLADGKKIEKFLVVNKERIFMENVGAVKELCKLTDKLEIRINELEKVNKKLQSRRRADTASSCFSNLSRASSFSRGSACDNKANNKDSPLTKEKKQHLHGKQHCYRCNKHNSHQQEVVMDEQSWCTPRFMQFLIIALILVMCLSIGAMAALYVMQDSKQNGYPDDASEAFKENKPRTTSNPTTSLSGFNFTTTTRPTRMESSSISLITKLSTKLIRTERKTTKTLSPSEQSAVTTGVVLTNTTTTIPKSSQVPPYYPIITESKQRPPTPTPSKPVCQCCRRTAEKCDSIPYKRLGNKPVYSEMSNALLPAITPHGPTIPQDINLRIVEKNYNLKCDSCSSVNESFYIPVSSAVSFKPITLEINSTGDSLVLLCSKNSRLECPETSSQPLHDTTQTMNTWLKSHRWRLRVAFFYSSNYRFRVVKSSANTNNSRVNCSTTASPRVRHFKDLYLTFIRICKT